MEKDKAIAIGITERFFEKRGYEILESRGAEWPYGFDVLAKDEDTLVFTYVRSAADGDFPIEDVTREAAEADTVAWFNNIISKQQEPESCNFRFDIVSVRFLDTDKHALLRHHINALSPDEDKEAEA